MVLLAVVLAQVWSRLIHALNSALPALVTTLTLLTPLFLLIHGALGKRVVAAIRTGDDGDWDIGPFRVKLLWFTALSFTATALVCWFHFQLTDLPLWLVVPIFWLILSLRLTVLTLNDYLLSKLAKVMCKNLMELLLIATVVLIFFLLLNWRFDSQDLNVVTFKELQKWNTSIYDAHHFFDTHKLGVGSLFLLSLVLFCLRIRHSTYGGDQSAVQHPSSGPLQQSFRVNPVSARSEATRRASRRSRIRPFESHHSVRPLGETLVPRWKKLPDQLSRLISGSIIWFGRATTALTLAASLTFFATKDLGFSKRLALQVKESDAKYQTFQADLSKRADTALKHHLLYEALRQSPPPLRVELYRAAQFEQSQQDHNILVGQAKSKYGIQPEAHPSETPTSAAPPHWELPPACSPKDVEEAAGEIKGLRVEYDDQSQDEVAEKLFETVVTHNDVSGLSALIDAVKEHNPILGEFLDVIMSSVSDFMFDAMKDSVVRKIDAARLRHPHSSLSDAQRAAIAATTQTVRFKFERLDKNWRRIANVRLDDMKKRLAGARRQLESEASTKFALRIQNAQKEEASKEETLGKIARDERLKNLQRVVAARKSLTELAKSWPTLTEPSMQQKGTLQNVYNEFQESNESPTVNDRWTNPEEALRSLSRYSDEAILNEFTAAHAEERIDALRTAVGESYGFYESQWKKRIETVRRPPPHQIRGEEKPWFHPIPK